LDGLLREAHGRLTLGSAQVLRQMTWETQMTWKTPKIVEVQVGMEINMYVCATRK
jgi:coenzyme PQQ precursor peptide PqqA